MFENIGRKIKTLAETLCWLGIVVSVLAGLTITGKDIIVGLLVLIIGSLCSWIGSFFAYGFGELIEKTTEIAANTSCFNNEPNNTSDNEYID